MQSTHYNNGEHAFGSKIWIKLSFKKTHQSNLRQKKKKKKKKHIMIPEFHSSSTVS
jgi:hypothetical protein